MTLDTGSRVDFAVNFMLTQIIASMGKIAFGGIGELGAWLDFFLMGMTVGTKRLLMTGGTGIFRSGIYLVLDHKIGSLVIKCTP